MRTLTSNEVYLIIVAGIWCLAFIIMYVKNHLLKEKLKEVSKSTTQDFQLKENETIMISHTGKIHLIRVFNRALTKEEIEEYKNHTVYSIGQWNI